MLQRDYSVVYKTPDYLFFMTSVKLKMEGTRAIYEEGMTIKISI